MSAAAAKWDLLVEQAYIARSNARLGISTPISKKKVTIDLQFLLDVRPRSTEMSSEQTTEVRSMGSKGTVELNLENYEAYPAPLDWLELIRRERRAYGMMTSYPDVDFNIISQAHPGSVTRRTENDDAVPIEPYADILKAIERVRSTTGARGPPIQLIGAAEATPGFTVGDAVGVELNGGYFDYIRAAAHIRRSAFGAGSGYINETVSAEASSALTVVLGADGGGDALGVELNDEMLTALRLTARAMRGHGALQDVLVDEAGGRFLVIHIHPPHQGDQGLVAAPCRAEDGPGDLAQRALQSVFGGVVPLCYTLLDDTLKGSSPGYIKAATYAGLGLVTGFMYLGLASKKRAKAAARVVGSTSMAALSIALVYNVSENVYIKCVCGIMGGVATLATMAIDW